MEVKLKTLENIPCFCSTNTKEQLQQLLYTYLAVFAAYTPKRNLRKCELSSNSLNIKVEHVYMFLIMLLK